MDGRIPTQRKKNPREDANPLSALTFTYILNTFWVGSRRDLEVDDLTEPLKEHKSNLIGDKLTTAWNIELRRLEKQQKAKKDVDSRPKTPSLLRVFIKLYGVRMFFYGVALGVQEIILLLFQPIALARLLSYFSSAKITKDEAYFYAGIVVLCSAIKVFIAHASCMAMVHMGMKLRVACCSLIYRKTLKLSKTALAETSVGQAVNLISGDVFRLDYAVIFFHYLWVGPVETIIITYLMYQEVGIASIFGIASLLMFIPLQGYLGKKASTLRLRTAIKTDERVSLTDEIIKGIQAIKMYTWERPFSALIQKVREREVRVIRLASHVRGIIMSFMMFSTRLSLFITILAYVFADNPITAEKVFMLTAYYNILRETMTITFPYSVTHIAETLVSIKRLETFLMSDEIYPKNRTTVHNEKSETKENLNCELNGHISAAIHNDGSVTLENVSARWTDTVCEDTLKELNMKVKPGQLIAVVGQVGSGKSSLLNVLLRELPTTQGTMNLPKKIAYASQEPWLFAGSVRQNILFGRAMDPKKYEQVIKACQLKRDFIMLPYGDKTIVGDRGISLSGGQRARINLARAVYADAPLYLLDDPLSAVDAHVGKHMFEECIENYLKGRTRILVTHQIQFLRNVEKIIVMKDGRVEAEGTYDKLLEMGIDFGSLLESESSKLPNGVSSSLPPTSTPHSRQPSITTLGSFMISEGAENCQEEPEEIAEMRTKGHVKGYVWSSYCKAGGNGCAVFLVVLLFIGSQLCGSGGDYFIGFWVNLEQRYQNSTNYSTENVPDSRGTYIYIFSGLIVITIIVTFVRSFTFFYLTMQASKRLHDRMFRSIIRATMRFFNSNHSGRVLNRFSRDLGVIDELLPVSMIDSFEIGLFLLGIILVVGVVNPWLLLPAVVMGVVFYVLRIIYLATSRSVKRLEGVTRSPVLNHFNATLQGLVTIRSAEADSILTTEFDHHQDLHSSAWYVFMVSSQAFGFWLDIFCLIYIALVTMSFVLLSEDGSTSSKGGDVGLAITQSIGLTGMLQWGMRQSAELENQMTSVERVLEYTKIESEPPLTSQMDKKPVDDWPQEGRIEFKNVCLTYDPSEPPVLKDLNFTIEPRERVGIVGRTGAGKSSLISALFRLADIKGKIEIDSVDVGEIGLHDFRSKISIIPQEPFLFAGTLRRNLDPFEQYGDSVLWAALEDVEMKEMDLESRISEGGNNLSVGQRQLICLARAIVRNNKILVLDEATANVDLRTDELIQRTIRQKFADCTVLTIAHRLNTVMDSDRILVMDDGSVVEFDHPHVLLQNSKGGFFANLVQETGESMAEVLATTAGKNYEAQLY